MAINVTLSEVKTQESKPFPKLMIANHKSGASEGMIVLFEMSEIGTVIFSVHHSQKVGEYSKDFYMPAFTDYNSPITLQNS